MPLLRLKAGGDFSRELYAQWKYTIYVVFDIVLH